MKKPVEAEGSLSPPKDIIKAAKSSVASFSLAKELILPKKISTLLHLMERIDTITDILSDLYKSTVIKNLEIITFLDGVDTAIMAYFTLKEEILSY